ncbi:MAG: endonuclease III domain-containing protein [Elusimicrobiota bacterium]
MNNQDIHAAVRILKKEIKRWKTPVVGLYDRDPFLVLISCVLSLRTKDAVTAAASERLFHLAQTPRAMVRLPPRSIERAIYPVSFYRNKTRHILSMCQDILSRFGGRVPDAIDDLLTLKGVGRKTANLTVTLGYRKPGICVDTHVHRISNRWGYIDTKSPEESETALRQKLPKRYWIIYNDLLVAYGQNLCAPVSPWCSRCRLSPYCERRGVKASR